MVSKWKGNWRKRNGRRFTIILECFFSFQKCAGEKSLGTLFDQLDEFIDTTLAVYRGSWRLLRGMGMSWRARTTVRQELYLTKFKNNPRETPRNLFCCRRDCFATRAATLAREERLAKRLPARPWHHTIGSEHRETRNRNTEKAQCASDRLADNAYKAQYKSYYCLIYWRTLWLQTRRT